MAMKPFRKSEGDVHAPPAGYTKEDWLGARNDPSRPAGFSTQEWADAREHQREIAADARAINEAKASSVERRVVGYFSKDPATWDKLKGAARKVISPDTEVIIRKTRFGEKPDDVKASRDKQEADLARNHPEYNYAVDTAATKVKQVAGLAATAIATAGSAYFAAKWASRKGDQADAAQNARIEELTKVVSSHAAADKVTADKVAGIEKKISAKSIARDEYAKVNGQHPPKSWSAAKISEAVKAGSQPASRRAAGDPASVAVNPDRARRTMKARGGERSSIDGKTVHLARVDAGSLHVDPSTFQFKSGGDSHGVTDRLRGVKTWNALAAGTAMVYERANGEKVVADGHQRTGLAHRLLLEGHKAIKMSAIVMRERDGWTPRDVRAYAAIKNMHESSGNSLDMAKVMRERPDLVGKSLPVTDAKIREAKALANLSGPAFDMVVGGAVKPEHAAAVGESVKEASRHVDMLTEMQKAKVASAQHARIYVQQALAAPTITESSTSLFGEEKSTRSLLNERSAILDKALSALKSDRRIFGLLERESANIESVGNKLSHEANASKAEGAGKLAELVEKLSTTRGRVSDMIDRAAMQVAAGESPAKAARAFVRSVGDVMKEGGMKALTSDEPRRMVEMAYKPRPGSQDALMQRTRRQHDTLVDRARETTGLLDSLRALPDPKLSLASQEAALKRLAEDIPRAKSVADMSDRELAQLERTNKARATPKMAERHKLVTAEIERRGQNPGWSDAARAASAEVRAAAAETTPKKAAADVYRGVSGTDPDPKWSKAEIEKRTEQRRVEIARSKGMGEMIDKMHGTTKGQTSMLPDASTKEKIAAASKSAGKPKAPQRDVAGLFGDGHKQTDLVDMAKAAPKIDGIPDKDGNVWRKGADGGWSIDRSAKPGAQRKAELKVAAGPGEVGAAELAKKIAANEKRSATMKAKAEVRALEKAAAAKAQSDDRYSNTGRAAADAKEIGEAKAKLPTRKQSAASRRSSLQSTIDTAQAEATKLRAVEAEQRASKLWDRANSAARGAAAAELRATTAQQELSAAKPKRPLLKDPEVKALLKEGAVTKEDVKSSKSMADLKALAEKSQTARAGDRGLIDRNTPLPPAFQAIKDATIGKGPAGWSDAARAASLEVRQASAPGVDATEQARRQKAADVFKNVPATMARIEAANAKSDARSQAAIKAAATRKANKRPVSIMGEGNKYGSAPGALTQLQKDAMVKKGQPAPNFSAKPAEKLPPIVGPETPHEKMAKAGTLPKGENAWIAKQVVDLARDGRGSIGRRVGMEAYKTLVRTTGSNEAARAEIRSVMGKKTPSDGMFGSGLRTDAPAPTPAPAAAPPESGAPTSRPRARSKVSKAIGLLAPIGIASAMLAGANEAKAEGSSQVKAAAKEGVKSGAVMAGFMAGTTLTTAGLMKAGMTAARAIPAVGAALMVGGAIHGAATAKPGERLQAAAKGAWDMSLPGMVVNTAVAAKGAVSGRLSSEQAMQFSDKNEAYAASRETPEDGGGGSGRGFANAANQAAAQQARGVENVTDWAQGAVPQSPRRMGPR